MSVLESLEKSDLKNCGKIFLHWAEIVGSSLACHTRPWQVRAKKLKVLVDSSDWLYQIQAMHEGEILKRVQDRVGTQTIQEITYVVSDGV